MLYSEPRATGWRAIFRDWRHFVRMSGETGAWAYVRVLYANPSLWALWIYRYGYWTYRVCPRFLSIPHKVLYNGFYLLGQWVFKIALAANADILDDVWLSPIGNILVAQSRVGTGTCLHGANTLGTVFGQPVFPTLGDRVQVGIGATVVGGVTVPSDTVIGPNAVVVRSIPEPGAWTGAPVRPFDGPSSQLISATRTGRSAGRAAAAPAVRSGGTQR